ncbi:cysteine peptidase family C39 domain-containing protein [Flavobacterium davisii]|uniref:cysteine peptidase family C39 domain-containing protein n=1 Tax=Flavobacterium davisii TaxID=2906077 RepID=UPI0035CF864A
MNQPKATKPTALRLPKNTIGTVNPRSSNEGYSAEFYGNKSNEGVDFSSLIRFIKKVSTNPQCIFNWKDFERAPTVQTYSTRDGEGGTIQRMKIINNNIPFTYKDEYGKTNTSFLQARLNKRIDAIDYDWGFSIQIDAKSKLIFAQLSLYYVNTAKFRNKVTATPNPNDFTVNDQYRGIVFQSENLTDFAYLVNAIDPSQFEFIKNKIKTKFVDAIQKAKNEDEIVFLFENTPNWIAENFKSDELINYLKTILSYDIEGWFSGYIDGSCAFINVLRGFNTLDKWVDLYHFFKQNPEFVKKAYHGLDSTSIWEGVKQTNKTIFASFLTSLSYAVMDSEKVAIEPPTKTFYLGDGYTINTSALGALDFNDTQYFLKQERTKLVGMIPIANSWFYPVTYDEDLEEGAYYNPLQMVQVYNVAQKTAMVVPAIFLHDTASRDELAQIMKAVRIGVNVFTIAVSIASLGSASPLIALAAAADITLATADTIFALAEDQLSKEFVETWSKIYLVGGAITAGPVLLNSVFKGGMKILNGTAKAEFKHFVRAFIFKVVIEKNIANFTKNTLRFVTENVELISISNGLLNTAKLQELNQYGAILVAGEVKNADRIVTEYALVYKGELVIKGEKASFVKRVERFFEKAKNKGIKEYLEKIIEFRKVGIGSIKYTKIISRNMLKQEHQMSCAAACLKQYSTDFGFNFTEEVIRTMAKTTEETGTFPSGMKSAFEEIFKNDIIDIGMKYVPNISDIDMAKKLTKDGSWIAFVLPKNSNVQHSIIVDKIIGNNVHIRDPWPLEKIFSEGRNGVEAIIDIYEFEHMWMYGQNWCFRIIK